MKVNANDLKFSFTDNMPADDVATVAQIVSAGAQVPQEYLYQYLPNVQDPSEITEQLETERTNQVQQARAANGLQTDAELSANGEERTETE